MSPPPTPREMGYYGQLAQVGMEMAFPAAIGAYLDYLLETAPWFTVALAVFGFIAGLTHLILIVKAKEREDSADKKPRP